MTNNPPILFPGQASSDLAKSISQINSTNSIHLGKIHLHSFPSGEHYCQLQENVRGKDVFLLQSTHYPANDNLMQLLVMIDAAKRASAERITAIIPSVICYSRQDRKDKSRTPISAKLIANLLTASGANRILGLDFHSPQFAGFFDIPVDQLYAVPIFTEYLYQTLKLNDLIVVSPDVGAVKRSSELAKILKSDLAIHFKRRIGDETVESQGLIGEVKNKNVIIYDDLVESAGTLVEVARVCKQSGAKGVFAFITHNCLTEIGYQRLKEDIFLDKLIVTDSTPTNIISPKIEKVSVASLFATAIQRIHISESISDLFEIKGY